jgi:putative hydrolase of the HAD superfamily
MSCNRLPDIKAIFFDFGGVLLQHADGIDHAAIESALGLPERTLWNCLYRESRYRDYQVGRCSDDEWIESVYAAARRLAADKADALMEAWQKAEAKLNPDMAALVRRLHGRYTLGIISNTTPGMDERLRERFGDFRDYFDIRIGSGDLGIAKPDPNIWRHAVSLAGLPMDACVYTDDHEAYALVARGLGMHGFHFTDHSRFVEDLRSVGVEVGQ